MPAYRPSSRRLSRNDTGQAAALSRSIARQTMRKLPTEYRLAGHLRTQPAGAPDARHDAERIVRNPARYAVSGRIGVATVAACGLARSGAERSGSLRAAANPSASSEKRP